MTKPKPHNLIKHYVKYWLAILIFSLAGFIIGLIYNGLVQTPRYKSSATLIIIKSDDSNTSKNTTLINNYIELFKSRKVLEPTIADLKLNQTYSDLVGSIEATNDINTEVVKLSISAKDPKTSQETLNHAITIFKDEAKKLYKKDNIQVVDNASIDSKPYNVNTVLQLAMATFIGFIAPVIVIFFIYDLNTEDENKHEKEESTKTPPTPTNNVAATPEQTPTRTNNHQTQYYSREKPAATVGTIVENPPHPTTRSLNIPNRRG